MPNDPKLTAYALGELTGDERAAVEAALRHDPRLRATVEDIRAAAVQLEAVLADETILPAAGAPLSPLGNRLPLNGHTVGGSIPTPPPRLRRRLAAGSKDAGRKRDGDYAAQPARAKLLRFPQFYYVVGTAAAAGFAVLVALREPKPVTMERDSSPQSVFREVALVPPTGTEPAVRPTDTAPPPQLNVSIGPAANSALRPEVTRSAAAPNDAVMDDTRDRPTRSSGRADSLAIGNRVNEDSIGGPAPLAELSAGVAASAGARSTPDARDGEAPTNTGAGSPAASDTAGSVASAASGPVRTITFNAPAPITAGSALALTSTGSLIPGSINLLPTSPITAVPGSGETVMLSAFMVAADRAPGFAVLSDPQNSPRAGRGTGERAHLPHPPPGAKFGRNADAYTYVRDNDFVSVRHNQLSTFSIDVDTASYANVRRMIQNGSPPPRDAVRIEELLNYFPYRYPAPQGDAPFAASLEVADAPWAPTTGWCGSGSRLAKSRTSSGPRPISCSSSMSRAR